MRLWLVAVALLGCSRPVVAANQPNKVFTDAREIDPLTQPPQASPVPDWPDAALDETNNGGQEPRDAGDSLNVRQEGDVTVVDWPQPAWCVRTGRLAGYCQFERADCFKK